MTQRLVIAVLTKDDRVISYATNEHEDCARIGYPTGQGYDLCEGCDYPNHAEWKAIKEAIKRGNDPAGATLHLFGHYYACDSCKQVCAEAGVALSTGG